MLGHPAFVARHVRRDAQPEALLAEQRVAAVAGAVRPDLARLREVDDVLVRIARPGHVGLRRARAARRRCACTARRASRRGRSPRTPAVPIRAMIRMLTTTYGESVSWTPICDIGEPTAPMLKASTYIVRPGHAAAEQLLQLPAHLERVDPVVGRAGGVLRQRADEGALLDARDVARRPTARSSTPARASSFSLMNVPVATIWRTERVVLLLRAVHPVHGGRARQVPHLLDPAQQVGVVRERGRRIARQRCVHAGSWRRRLEISP